MNFNKTMIIKNALEYSKYYKSEEEFLNMNVFKLWVNTVFIR